MEKQKLEISFFADWGNVPDCLFASAFAEFHDNGAENLVFVDHWMERLLKEPGFFRVLTHAAKNKIRFLDMHAPFGECYDLACITQARRESLISDHAKAIAYAGDLGCRTYTIHIGAYNSVIDGTPNDVLRPLAVESLEKLLPIAEKHDVVIAVENAFERSNTPDEVIYYVNYFNHPYIGSCFDAGHANMMKNDEDRQANYSNYFINQTWQGEPIFEKKAFEKMSPSMITCHLHDNNGAEDQHLPPGMGIVNWQKMASDLLEHAPRLQTIQTEAAIFGCGISISDLVDRYKKIFPSFF